MKKLVITFTLLLFYTHAYSAIQERDLISNSNDKLITFDTVNNLEWLDLTYTNGRSVHDIENNWGGLLDLGFRYATLTDLTKMFNSLGLDIGKNYTTVPYYADSSTIYSMEATNSIIDAIHKFGVIITSDNAGVIQQEWSMGIYGLDKPDEYFRYPYLVIHYQKTSFIGSSIYIDMSSNGGIKLGGGPMGNWLVRSVPTPVPEPSLYGMLVVGLGLILMTQRHRRYHN